MTLKINVTKNDIAKAITACQGGTWLTEGCPVAQALMRTFPDSFSRNGRLYYVPTDQLAAAETKFLRDHE